MDRNANYVRAPRLAAGMMLMAATLCAMQAGAQPVVQDTGPGAGIPPERRASRGADVSLAKALGRGRFVYKADGKRLAELLQDFAASRGVPAIVAEGVEGTVNASFDIAPEEFLASISRAYNLLWYFDGVALYFYPGRAVQSRMIHLRGFDRQQLTQLMKSLAVGDQRYPIRFDDLNHTLLVVGPPRHVELVTAAVSALDRTVSIQADRTTRIFPLRYASAAERTVGGQVVPGLVNTLKSIFGLSLGGDSASVGVASAVDFLRKQTDDKKQDLAEIGGLMSTVKSKKLIAPRSQGARDAGADKVPMLAAGESKDAARDGMDDRPMFVPDSDGNAVIVSGRSDRMAEYESVIAQLDKPLRLIELQATIIDISSDSVDSLGLDWSVKSANGSELSVQGGGAAAGPFTISTLVADAGRSLMSRVSALQGEGKAKVIARPSILGLVNRTAVMREKRVVNVRVAGNYEVNLFSVEAGTLLEMTPQWMGGDSPRIKLALYIEDGNFEEGTVDQIPIVKKTEIRTEAHVRIGQSLLIAGLTVDSESDNQRGVPGLRRVPVFGGLFSSRDQRGRRTERMFLITPRLVADMPGEASVSKGPALSSDGSPHSDEQRTAMDASSRAAPSASAIPAPSGGSGR